MKQVAHYVYDAWGNIQVLQDTDGIATLNPFRYRSYYFDEETGLYYLQSRYYDPELGRFISADSIAYLDPETLGGLNLYAYCGNNPVMAVDSTGSDSVPWWKWLISGLQIVIGIVLIATGLGAGLGASLVAGGALGIVSNLVGSQIGDGVGSIVNGAGAISTGVSLLSFGWVGTILGISMIAIGGFTALFGANEVVSGITGTNFVRDWMGEDLYDGIYFGLNIASSIGTIAANIGMRIASNNILNGILENPEKINKYNLKQIKTYGKYSSQWKSGTLSKGNSKGFGYKLTNGKDGLISWSPGSGHHGNVPYWKVSSGTNGTKRYIYMLGILLDYLWLL